MKIFNTLSKQVEEFVPYDKNEVKMYTCGPTVYSYAHIGNLRTYIFEDVLQKGLEYLGYNVKRVMNITDVGHLTGDSDDGEDKMEKGAKKEGKTVYEIAEFYTKAFLSDIDILNIKRPKIIEKASDHIDTYIEMIQKMLEDGYAYISNGNVYFDITKASDYYKLSGKKAEDMLVGVRDTVDNDLAKKNPADFVLWFTLSKFENQTMKWDSPWGIGYPGWHIECSGISCKYLGEYLDIHCGAVDNIFPHHTNEIAQSEAYYGHKWCKYWIHGEYLNDSTGKMSKSKGEFLTLSLLRDKGYDPLAYRYFCLGSHYRKPLVFTYESLDGAQNAYQKLLNKIKKIDGADGVLDNDKIDLYDHKFKEAIEADLNMSMMLTILYDLLKDDSVNGATKKELVKKFDSVLSLSLLKEETKNDDEKILAMIEERKQAKEAKDYQKADEIRDELLKQGIRLIDSATVTSYEYI